MPCHFLVPGIAQKRSAISLLQNNYGATVARGIGRLPEGDAPMWCAAVRIGAIAVQKSPTFLRAAAKQ
jgi:hypothetical protein